MTQAIMKKYRHEDIYLFITTYLRFPALSSGPYGRGPTRSLISEALSWLRVPVVRVSAGCIYFCARVESAPTTWRIRAREGKQARTWGKAAGFKFPLLHINNLRAGRCPDPGTQRGRLECVRCVNLRGSEVKKATRKRNSAIYSAIVLLASGVQRAP